MIQRTILLPPNLAAKLDGIVEASEGVFSFNDVVRAILASVPSDTRLEAKRRRKIMSPANQSNGSRKEGDSELGGIE